MSLLRRLALRVLPWLLLAAMTGFAAIGWTHFLAKDEALWRQAFDTVAGDSAALAALDAGDPASAIRHLRQRRDAACAWIDRYQEHATTALRADLAEAQATCASRIDPTNP